MKKKIFLGRGGWNKRIFFTMNLNLFKNIFFWGGGGGGGVVMGGGGG